MATIGTFQSNDDGSYAGTIKTLTLNVKAAQFRQADKENDKAPDYRIFLRFDRVRRRLEEDLARRPGLPLGQARRP